MRPPLLHRSTAASGPWLALLALLALGLAGGWPAAAQTATNELRLLIITGIDYPGHRWRETTPYLVEALGRDPRMRVDVLSDPYRMDHFDLSPYHAVILHFMNWEKPDPNAEAQERLRRFVADGGGVVSIHFACGAFSNWTEYPNLLGKVWDGRTTHDPRGPFVVDIVHTNHPITRTLGSSFETDDELYFCLTGTKPVEILATARSKVTKRDEPMGLVHTYGRGRVFLTPLGHDVRALRAAGTTELIRRACAWVARRE